MWNVPELNEDYVRCMEDVLKTYEQPYDPKQPVVCVDEKPVTLHADVRPPSPAQPGREARHDSEYERRGTANVFCAVEPKAGRHFTFATPDRSGFEFARVASRLALQYPAAETIHLVLDNLNIHRRKSLTDAFGADLGTEIWDRFTVHYTPTHGSWLNQAEIEIGLFARQCLGKRRIPDLTTLRCETRAWNRRINRAGVKIDWRFTRRDARRKSVIKRTISRGQRTSLPSAGKFWGARHACETFLVGVSVLMASALLVAATTVHIQYGFSSIRLLVRQKKSWVDFGSGSLPSE